MQRSPTPGSGGPRYIAEDPEEARSLVEHDHDQPARSMWASDRSLYYKILLAIALGTLSLLALVSVTGLSKDDGLGVTGIPSAAVKIQVQPSVPAATATPTSSSTPGKDNSSKKQNAGAAAAALLTLKDGWRWEEYHSLEDMQGFLVWLAEAAPTLCRTYTIGTSVKGREIRAVELGPRDGADKAKFRPAVKLSAGQHGDEPASMELMLRLAWHLVASYGREARITELLDATAVHVLPVINPDALVARTRNNANGADLNRNFPLDNFPYPKPGPSKQSDSNAVLHWREAGDKPLQPENQAIMDWARAVPAVLSGNAHGGALVTNYPLDACDQLGLETHCPTADDPVPHFLASLYAGNHPEMRVNQAEGFSNGTTRGSRWYPVMGSMQDWLYHNTESLDLTFELHEHKTPLPAYMATMWVHNLPALLRFCEAAHIGVVGRVEDAAAPGKPVAAKVEVVAPKAGRPVATDAAAGGRFFKLLMPMRQYCLRVLPEGYAPVLVAVRVPQGPEAVVRGAGLQGLTVEVVVPARSGDAAAGEVLVVGGADKVVCAAVAKGGSSGAR